MDNLKAKIKKRSILSIPVPGKRNKYRLKKESNKLQTKSVLHILHVEKSDFGTYFCVAKNSLGEQDGAIKLSGTHARVRLPNHLNFPTTKRCIPFLFLSYARNFLYENKSSISILSQCVSIFSSENQYFLVHTGNNDHFIYFLEHSLSQSTQLNIIILFLVSLGLALPVWTITPTYRLPLGPGSLVCSYPD